MPPRKRPDDSSKPRLPVATPLSTSAPPTPAVLAALEAELFPAAPGSQPVPAAEPLPMPARAALGIAYEAVLRELSGPESPKVEPAPGSNVTPAPAPVAVAPDIVAWFSERGLDLAEMTETLLRSYMRELDEQQRRRMG